MNQKQYLQWQKVRKQGFLKFILYNTLYFFGAGLSVSLLAAIYQLARHYLYNSFQPKFVYYLVLVGIFLFFGFIVSIIKWISRERQFQKSTLK